MKTGLVCLRILMMIAVIEMKIQKIWVKADNRGYGLPYFSVIMLRFFQVADIAPIKIAAQKQAEAATTNPCQITVENFFLLA